MRKIRKRLSRPSDHPASAAAPDQGHPSRQRRAYLGRSSTATAQFHIRSSSSARSAQGSTTRQTLRSPSCAVHLARQSSAIENSRKQLVGRSTARPEILPSPRPPQTSEISLLLGGYGSSLGVPGRRRRLVEFTRGSAPARRAPAAGRRGLGRDSRRSAPGGGDAQPRRHPCGARIADAAGGGLALGSERKTGVELDLSRALTGRASILARHPCKPNRRLLRVPHAAIEQHRAATADMVL